MTTPAADSFVRALRAGARGLGVITQDEDRARAMLESVGRTLEWPVHVWSAASGLDGSGQARTMAELLARIVGSTKPALWVLLQADALTGPADRRALRELAQRSHGPAIALVELSELELRHIPELVVTRLAPPDETELTQQLMWIGEQLERAGYAGATQILSDQAALVPLARAALGLTQRELDRLIAECVVETGKVDPEALLQWVRTHKSDGLRPGAPVERALPAPVEALGGLEPLKTWLRRRALALEPRAAAAGIPAPRGMLLVGVQGCGKSLAARTSAHVLDLPLFRLDPGRVFSGTVGASESNLRRATETVERLAPLVLWIDEIDKAFAGSDGSRSDAGTAARVLGGLLTWLQERDRPVFVVATANRIDALPPELLRRGRLDEVFFVDLPDAATRRAIAQIHLFEKPERALGHVPPFSGTRAEFLAAAEDAEGFSGAELEAAIVEARLAALAEARALAPSDLAHALEETVPLSRTRAEDVESLRAWARGRARKA